MVTAPGLRATWPSQGRTVESDAAILIIFEPVLRLSRMIGVRPMDWPSIETLAWGEEVICKPALLLPNNGRVQPDKIIEANNVRESLTGIFIAAIV